MGRTPGPRAPFGHALPDRWSTPVAFAAIFGWQVLEASDLEFDRRQVFGGFNLFRSLQALNPALAVIIGVGHYIRMSDCARSADIHLAVYGTLAPGRVNHHQLAELKGRWQRGTVQGKLIAAGWGTALGFPGLILDPSGPPVEVYLFESLDLPDHWPRLDEFEGPSYKRVVTQVRTAGGELSAHIYVVAPFLADLAAHR